MQFSWWWSPPGSRLQALPYNLLPVQHSTHQLLMTSCPQIWGDTSAIFAYIFCEIFFLKFLMNLRASKWRSGWCTHFLCRSYWLKEEPQSSSCKIGTLLLRYPGSILYSGRIFLETNQHRGQPSLEKWAPGVFPRKTKPAKTGAGIPHLKHCSGQEM